MLLYESKFSEFTGINIW